MNSRLPVANNLTKNNSSTSGSPSVIYDSSMDFKIGALFASKAFVQVNACLSKRVFLLNLSEKKGPLYLLNCGMPVAPTVKIQMSFFFFCVCVFPFIYFTLSNAR